MAVINKMAPLFITVTILLMELFVQRPKLGEIVGKVVAALFLLPFAIGVIYSVCTLSFFFSFVFLPIPILMAFPVGICAAMLALVYSAFSVSLKYIKKEFNLDLAWFWDDERDQISDDPLTLVVAVSLILMLLAPFLTCGAVLAFVVYSGKDGGQAIVWMYKYVFAPVDLHFELPSFMDLAVLFEGFPDNLIDQFSSLHKYLQIPSVHALALGTAANVVGTLLSMLRSFILGVNAAVFAINKDCAVETRPVAHIALYVRDGELPDSSKDGEPDV